MLSTPKSNLLSLFNRQTTQPSNNDKMDPSNSFVSSLPVCARPDPPLPQEQLTTTNGIEAPQDGQDPCQQGFVFALPVREKLPQRGPEPPTKPPTEPPPFTNYAAEPKPQSRLPNRDGKTPATQCFYSVHIGNHEYHHLLECGHEVFTPTRQPCGGNCALKQRTTIKATGSILMCPDKTCTARLKAQLKSERTLFAKGSKSPTPRKCTLSDARGGSHDALDIRIAEAKLLRVAETSKTVVPSRIIETQSRARRATRERSLSPDAAISTRKNFREREPLRPAQLPSLQRPQGKSKLQSDSLFVAQDESDEAPITAKVKQRSKQQPFDWNEQNFSSLAEKKRLRPLCAGEHLRCLAARARSHQRWR